MIFLTSGVELCLLFLKSKSFIYCQQVIIVTHCLYAKFTMPESHFSFLYSYDRIDRNGGGVGREEMRGTCSISFSSCETSTPQEGTRDLNPGPVHGDGCTQPDKPSPGP